jgi:hypothetical protein
MKTPLQARTVLTAKALKAINTPVIRRELMDALNLTEFTIARYIQRNSDNLTKAAALEVIREWTELSDSEILETIHGDGEYGMLVIENKIAGNGTE